MELFHFSTWKCAIWGIYLRRKFRVDDIYYMGKRVTIRPTGKRVFFSWTRKHNYENMHPKIIFAKFQTLLPTLYQITTLLILSINMNAGIRRRPKRGNETNCSMERMWCGGVSSFATEREKHSILIRKSCWVSRIFINHLCGIEKKPVVRHFYWGGGKQPPKPPPPPPPPVRQWFARADLSELWWKY